MRVLIADDEPKVRSALRLWLAEVLALEIIGEVEDVWALFDSLGTIQPDVLLLDALLTGLILCGTLPQVLAAVRRCWPGVAVIGLSPTLTPASSTPPTGVDAWVSKWESPDQLGQVLQHLQDATQRVGNGTPAPHRTAR
jgi:DNA-binding NarL/FixJ family response regulator